MALRVFIVLPEIEKTSSSTISNYLPSGSWSVGRADAAMKNRNTLKLVGVLELVYLCLVLLEALKGLMRPLRALWGP